MLASLKATRINSQFEAEAQLVELRKTAHRPEGRVR